MLETRFPRPPGDIGNVASFRMSVRHSVVRGASPKRVVREADPALLGPFIDAGQALVRDGAAALTTSCGFLARWQRELQSAFAVPLWSSSLLLLPELAHLGPGVITVDAAALDAAVLRGAGADPTTPVEGLDPGSALVRTLLEDRAELDPIAAEQTVVGAARRLCERHESVGAIVLECTNLPPYAAAVAASTGLPVHDLLGLVHERWRRLVG